MPRPLSLPQVMLRLAILFSFAAVSLACAPTTKTTTTTTTSTTSTTTTTRKEKREVGEAKVALVTHQDFDAKMIPAYLKVVRTAIEQHSKNQNVFYNRDLIDEKTENIGGKFGVVYTILGVDCDKLNEFIISAKGLSTFIRQVAVTCGGKTAVLPLSN
nr:Protein F58B4.4 [Haemonchus contortus]